MGESADSGSNEAGSDNVDRSNPNEMASRERDAVRAGTVTDGQGNPVTSINRDGTRSVVTTGTDYERSMAQQNFARETGNPLSKSAQNLAASVAERETAALERASDAGKLAGAPVAGSTLAQVDDVTAASDQRLIDIARAQAAEDFRAQEVAGVRAPPAMGQDMRLMSLPSPSPARALQTSPYRDTTTQLLGYQMLTTSRTPEERQDILQEIRNRATVGDEVARQVLEDQAARDDLDLEGAGRVDMSAPNPFAAPARQALVPVGIASTPQATAASVLRGPDNVIQEQRAAQAVAQPPMEQNLLTSLDLGTGTTAPASDFLARNPQPDAGGNLVNPLLQTGTAPMDVSGATTSAGLYGGYEDDPAYDADIFGVPRYAGGKTGLDGQMQGFSDARQMGDFVGSATEGNFLTDIMSFLPGLDPVEANRNNVRDMMEAGAQFNQESGKLELDTGRGTLRMSDSGTVTYSGMPNPDYTGPFGNLVNPPAQTDSEDGAMTTDVAKSPQDPCPLGYTLVNGVCQPVDDVTTAPPGSGFQFFPSGGFPTSFQPVTQATQVGQVNPFVLRPNVPQGIQGLSPTGAALGRQV